MSVLADYDKYDYDYSLYWEKREYEHKSEMYALNKLMKGVTGKRFIDVGGSYGRLLPAYKDKYEEVVILDYSLKTLQNNAELINQISPKTKLIAANAYKMPFKESSFDGGLMVRVLHHLTAPDQYFHEQRRIMAQEGHFFLEIPNKAHAKARIKGFIKGDKSVQTLQPQQQPSQGNNEGSRGEYVPFLNFHPANLTKRLQVAEFHVISQRACSFLRSTPLTKYAPVKASLSLEKGISSILKNRILTPSIIYHLQAIEGNEDNLLAKPLEELFICPKCKGELDLNSSERVYTCPTDNLSFPFVKGVWDFRYDE